MVGQLSRKIDNEKGAICSDEIWQLRQFGVPRFIGKGLSGGLKKVDVVGLSVEEFLEGLLVEFGVIRLRRLWHTIGLEEGNKKMVLVQAYFWGVEM